MKNFVFLTFLSPPPSQLSTCFGPCPCQSLSDGSFGQWSSWVCFLNLGGLSLVAQGLAGQKSDHGTTMLNIDKYSSLLEDLNFFSLLSRCSEGKALSGVKVLALKMTRQTILVMLLVITQSKILGACDMTRKELWSSGEGSEVPRLCFLPPPKYPLLTNLLKVFWAYSTQTSSLPREGKMHSWPRTFYCGEMANDSITLHGASRSLPDTESWILLFMGIRNHLSVTKSTQKCTERQY